MTYRQNVGICVVNTDGLIFIAQRTGFTPDGNGWQMPQGGIDANEDPLTAAKRELFEETSIPESDIQLLAEHSSWLTYDFPPEVALNDKGQRQKWFCFRYTGQGDINLDEAQDNEFSTWKWAPASTVIANIVPFKKEVYTQALAEFAPYLA